MREVDQQPQASVDLRALSNEIKHQALFLGFDKVGIVPAVELEPEGDKLREWLRRGYHADMKWMERAPEQRSDPRRFFPEARSVVVVALNYYSPERHEDHPETGKVSRYAWGDDYHDIVRRKLTDLLNWLQSRIPDVHGKVCVDIQPLMDKAWAARAGLGWIGKHTNLITPELGSWVFIGELLLNIEMHFDIEPIEDHCGTCTLCIDACPTDALDEPYVLDSRRCLSYVTIESREAEIPAPLSQQLSGWLYGCDICQDVCPWNRFATASDEIGFRPRRGNVNASLAEVIKLDPTDYAERYRGSAMKRAKLSGLKRNAKALLTIGSSLAD